MAEGPDPVVADLEQEVTCGICHDRYQEPKLLPCCHYYCKQCILTLSSRYPPNQPFPCPDCREPTLLPDNNPAEVVKRGKEAANPDPVEKHDFGVEVFVCEDLKKLCENNVIVFDGKPIVNGDGIKTAEVDKCARLNIYINSKQGKPKAVLISLVDQSTQQLQAVPVRDGVYSVEYTPRVRGRHHLLISVDDQPIPGSPFYVLVKIPPTKLDKPVRVIRGIKDPRYMAFNSSEELIVTDYSGDVLVFDKKGEQIRSISKSKHGFGSIYGVAVDKEDNIYVCDDGKHCVYKFNKRGDLLKRFGTYGSGPKELNNPRGIAVAGDQVFVCDRRNNRVQVLTTELEQIGSRGTGNEHFNGPEDVAVDEQMVYVTDCNNHRAQVLTMDGRFIRSLGKKGSGQGDVSGPYGVCVTGFVYVAEYSNKRVSVFTKDGQFVTSFGNGHITGPYGVAVDSDGFVYVCSNLLLYFSVFKIIIIVTVLTVYILLLTVVVLSCTIIYVCTLFSYIVFN